MPNNITWTVRDEVGYLYGEFHNIEKVQRPLFKVNSLTLNNSSTIKSFAWGPTLYYTELSDNIGVYYESMTAFFGNGNFYYTIDPLPIKYKGELKAYFGKFLNDETSIETWSLLTVSGNHTIPVFKNPKWVFDNFGNRTFQNDGIEFVNSVVLMDVYSYGAFDARVKENQSKDFEISDSNSNRSNIQGEVWNPSFNDGIAEMSGYGNTGVRSTSGWIPPKDTGNSNTWKPTDTIGNYLNSGPRGTSGTSGTNNSDKTTIDTNSTIPIGGTSATTTNNTSGTNGVSGTSGQNISQTKWKTFSRIEPAFKAPCGNIVTDVPIITTNTPFDLYASIFSDPKSDWSDYEIYSRMIQIILRDDLKNKYKFNTCSDLLNDNIYTTIEARIKELCASYAIRFEKIDQLKDFLSLYENDLKIHIENLKVELDCNRHGSDDISGDLDGDYYDYDFLFSQKSSMVYGKLSKIYDVVPDMPELTTWGVWDKREKITGIEIAPRNLSNENYLYREVFDSNTCYDIPHFYISYAHKYGSGSSLIRYGEETYPSKTNYSRFANKLLEHPNKTFGTKNGSVITHFYAIQVPRNKYTYKMDPGNWQLNFADLNPVYPNIDTLYLQETSSFVLQCIDDSVDSRQNYSQFENVKDSYYIMSGSLEEGVYDTSADSIGIFYPSDGLFILNADYMDQKCHFRTVVSSSVQGWNEEKLYKSLSGSIAPSGSRTVPFYQWGRGSDIKFISNYFIRVDDTEYNYSNNPTYYSDSNKEMHSMIMENNPISYITTIGLYNNRGELLAVAKTKNPIKKDFSKELVFQIRLKVK